MDDPKQGMLDAACPGDVFAAPPMDYLYETTKRLASPKGVLLRVSTYTGDRMAFDMGKELAEAEGIDVTRTMGVGLTACTPPARGSPLFDIGDDEMERRLVVFGGGGGVLLRTPDGEIAGGVRVSAGTVDEDHQVAEAGRKAFEAA